jgi:hypothetical protein
MERPKRRCIAFPAISPHLLFVKVSRLRRARPESRAFSGQNGPQRGKMLAARVASFVSTANGFPRPHVGF